MENRLVCVVTGSTGGIGFETCLGLAKKNFHVILMCRNKEKGEAAVEKIKKECEKSTVDLVVADMSSFESVRGACAEIKRKYDHVDSIVCNAGLGYLEKRTITSDQNEIAFQVKYLSHVLLIFSLLSLIQKSEDGRIILMSGSLHNHPIQLDDLSFEKKYSSTKIISHVNLACIMFAIHFTKKLMERNVGVRICTLHPGGVKTGLMDSFPKAVQLLLVVGKMFMHSPKSGAEPGVFLASSDIDKFEEGRYYNRKKPSKPNKIANNEEVQRQLWEKTLEILKIEEEEIFNFKEEEEEEGEGEN